MTALTLVEGNRIDWLSLGKVKKKRKTHLMHIKNEQKKSELM